MGSERFECTANDFKLVILIDQQSSVSEVFWNLSLISDPSEMFKGQGRFQKEIESEDAFSSFDESSAISYKNKRAVFVHSDDQAQYFPICVSATGF